jgi:hypothetical protein
MLHCSTAHETSDAAEAVDSEFDSHVGGEFVVVACLGALIWIYEKSEGVSGSFRLAPSRRHLYEFLCVVPKDPHTEWAIFVPKDSPTEWAICRLTYDENAATQPASSLLDPRVAAKNTNSKQLNKQQQSTI